MFYFLKKKRIDQYLRSANSYVAEIFKPEPKKEPEIRYSLSDAPVKDKDKAQDQSGMRVADKPVSMPMERYSSHDTDLDEIERGEVKYSERGHKDVIPNSGDSFVASDVKAFLNQYSTSPSISRLANKLDDCLDLTFVDILTRYINEKEWRDSRVYKAAQMDRRLFSKMMSDRCYKPSKDTAVALVIALELSLKQANDLLSRAGYTLSHSNKRDVIIEYFIREGIYNLSDINEVLYRLNQKIIGR